MLNQREKYKDLKGQAENKSKELKNKLANFDGTEADKHRLKEEIRYWEAEASANDKKQLPLKILANSFFGSFGAPDVFPMGDVVCAEKTTCIGRMSLRLMISHFKRIGYEPIVGDSVTEDTPLFVRYKDSNLIDIKPIGEIFNAEKFQTDVLGREYDYSEKPYQVLCRGGWSDVHYVYRHKTTKPIYCVSDDTTKLSVDVTEDHSLFDANRNEIKPSEITEDTKLEYVTKPQQEVVVEKYETKQIKIIAKMVADSVLDKVPVEILNSSKETKELFLNEFNKVYNGTELSKTCLACIQYIQQ